MFNNLLVNCKFRATTPAWEEPGSEDCYDGEHSMIDYNYYASGTVQSSIFYEGQYEDDGEMLLYSGVKFPYEAMPSTMSGMIRRRWMCRVSATLVPQQYPGLHRLQPG